MSRCSVLHSSGFRTDSPSYQDGVSAVIATLLLVAIGVFLTGAVLFTVSQLQQQKAERPMIIQFERVEEADRIRVTSAAGGADWSRVSVRLQTCSQAVDNAVLRLGGSLPYHNEDATGTGAALNAASAGASCGAGSIVAVASTRADIHANDFLDFCGTPSGAALTSVQLTLVDTSANTVLASPAFFTVADC